MAKKTEWVIEYRYDNSDPWVEYCRTFVPAAREEYWKWAHIEHPGAIVRVRDLDKH